MYFINIRRGYRIKDLCCMIYNEYPDSLFIIKKQHPVFQFELTEGRWPKEYVDEIRQILEDGGAKTNHKSLPSTAKRKRPTIKKLTEEDMQNTEIITSSYPDKHYLAKNTILSILYLIVTGLAFVYSNIFTAVLMLLCFYIIQRGLSLFKCCYKIELCDTTIILHYKTLFSPDKKKEIDGRIMNVIYDNYIRKPKKTTIRLNVKKEYSKITDLTSAAYLNSRQGWTSNDLDNLASRLREHNINVKQIDMR